MRLSFPTLSNLFTTWATAGHYSAVEELEIAADLEYPGDRAHPAHRMTTARRRASGEARPRRRLG